MKKLLILFIALISLSVSSCIENEEIILKDPFVEMDAATYNANTGGKDYPILNRVPGDGRAIRTSANTAGPADPLITRNSEKIKLRVNLVGPHRDVDTELSYSIVPNETYTTATINGETAIQGTHFNTSGTVVIPANSSFGYIEIDILNPGEALENQKLIVIELTGNDILKPNPIDRRVGILINKG